MGAEGRYGFYEAVDFTPTRVQEGETFAIVRAFMAHHQGMTIVAIANALFDGVMRERFHAEPIVQATELLLQERVPREVASMRPWEPEIKSAARSPEADPSGGRKIASPHQSIPSTLLLSNGRYAVMLTAAGSGYSRWGDIAITRWREDATRDDSGVLYLPARHAKRRGLVGRLSAHRRGARRLFRAVQRGSRGVHAARRKPDDDARRAGLGRGRRARCVGSPISNAGARSRDIEITSYAELALGPQDADVAHPAFAKLFVETEFLADLGAILATRRKRTPTEPEIWAGASQRRQRRSRRQAGIRNRPGALSRARANRRRADRDARRRPLSNSVGAVLDPVFALRRRVTVAPGASVRVAFWTLAAGSRAALLDQIDKHRDAAAYDRATTLAWTQAQVQQHHLGVKPGEAALFQRLASHVVYASPSLRPSSDTIRQGAGPQSGLWSQGISGDLPIVLLRIGEIENIGVARQILQRARILVDEAARGRSRHSQRAPLLLRPGPSDRAGDSGARQSVASDPGRRATPRSRLCAARGPDRGLGCGRCSSPRRAS